MVPPAGLEPAPPLGGGAHRRRFGTPSLTERNGTVRGPDTGAFPGYMYTGSWRRRKGRVGVPKSALPGGDHRPPTAISPVLRNTPTLCGGVFLSSTRPTPRGGHPLRHNPGDVCPSCITAAFHRIGFAIRGYSSPGPLSGSCIPGVAVLRHAGVASAYLPT